MNTNYNPGYASANVRGYEPIAQMLIEIEQMKGWCKLHYNEGGETMVRHWDDSSYEDLFYMDNLDAPENIRALQPRIRIPFYKAWERLNNLMEAYADQQETT